MKTKLTLRHAGLAIALALLTAACGSDPIDSSQSPPPGGSGPDTSSPSINITGPTSQATYATSSATINISGNASDNVGVSQVTWTNDRGGSGAASGTTSWSVNGITLVSGSNVLTFTARDAAMNSASDTLNVNYTPGGGGDTSPPSITITGPTSLSSYTTSSATIDLSGSASDNVGVSQVTWTNDRGGSGTASGTTSWSVNGVSLVSGVNVITVTASDAATNSASDMINVTYTPGGGTPGVSAFPGAQGFGAVATGGRGGRVVKVTNLNASGAGSLQAALNLNEARIVVFTVSGVIDSDISIPYGNLTIAGQTAPGAGITIRGRLFSDYSSGINNIIIRHLRVRPRGFTAAEGDPTQYDGIQFSLNRRLIFDHVSISFGVDENFDLYEAQDVTVQYSTIEQSSELGGSFGAEVGHNYGLINGPDGHRISVHHNLFAHNKNRNPAIANGPADVRNNVAYNVRHGFIHHNPASGPFDIVGNYYKQGPNDTLIPFYFDDENGGAAPDLRYYMHDNYIDDPGDYVGSVDNPWATPPLHPSFGGLGLPASYRSATEFDFSSYTGYVAVTTESSTAAYGTVLNKAGAWPRDVVTNKSVQDTRDRAGAWGANIPPDLLAGLVPGTPPTDTDNDGMPDSWETTHGLNAADGTDHRTVMPSGYTAIEEYINELADTIVP